MAINLDAIRSKLDKLQNQTTKQNNIWKPEAGKQQIRIVPYQYNKENPFLEMYFHYDLGKRMYTSPITYGRPDPVVEFCDKLKSSGNSDEWRLGKKMEPKMRVHLPIIVRGKESEGVKFWGFGKSVYTELLGFIADPDYGDITDPVHGRDIVIEFSPSDKEGTYPKTTIRIKPNATPLTEDRNIAQLIATRQPKIEDVFKEPSYAELEKALHDWLNPSESPDDSDATNPADTKNRMPEASNVAKVDDVSAAFDELFNS
jgi:hypothetical protein